MVCRFRGKKDTAHTGTASHQQKRRSKITALITNGPTDPFLKASGCPQHGDGLHAHFWSHFSHLLGTDGVVGFASSLMTHTLKQRYIASLEWGKIFPSRETCPAQAVKAVYLFVRRCSRPKAALCWCARDDQPGAIRYLTTSPNK